MVSTLRVLFTVKGISCVKPTGWVCFYTKWWITKAPFIGAYYFYCQGSKIVNHVSIFLSSLTSNWHSRSVKRIWFRTSLENIWCHFLENIWSVKGIWFIFLTLLRNVKLNSGLVSSSFLVIFVSNCT